MQIVIDIDDEEYEEIMCDEACGLNTLTRAIAQGIVLPKGHDDLIYRNETIKSLFDYYSGKKSIGQCIDDVLTVIEADKEVEHGENSN